MSLIKYTEIAVLIFNSFSSEESIARKHIIEIKELKLQFSTNGIKRKSIHK